MTEMKNKYDPTSEIMPNFNGLSVFVLAGACYDLTVAMFIEFGFMLEDNFIDADLVVFTGGTDVQPELYGQEPMSGQRYDRIRDKLEARVYEQCLEAEIPMIGFCRGSQFLAVMNGAKLWQDVNNHTHAHFIIDIERGCDIWASSTHHQMVHFDKDQMPDVTLLAVASEQIATSFANDVTSITTPGQPYVETEAYMFEKTKTMGIQGHPEFQEYVDFRHWTMNELKTFLFVCSDNVVRDVLVGNEVPILETV